MKKTISSWFLIVFLVVCAGGCGKKTESADNGKPIVFVSIPPQAFFVEKIAGDAVTVEVLVDRGQEPHTFAPTPRQISALGRAEVFFTIGVPFEQVLVSKLTDADLRIVDTAAGITRRSMKAYDHEDHGAGEADDHEDGRQEEHEGSAEHAGHDGHDCSRDHGSPDDGEGDDPHLWLDPILAKRQAANIAEALTILLPDQAGNFDANLKAFSKELENTHLEIEETLRLFKGRKFYVFHPSFGYFGDRYGLIQEAVEMEGKTPGPRQLAQLIRQAKEEKVKVLFVQPQFSARAAEKIAVEIGGTVMPLDIMSRDYINNLKAMAAGLKAGFENIE